MGTLALLPILLAAAVLLPLLSFFAILLLGPRMGRAGRGAGVVATGAIVGAALLSFASLVIWISHHPLPDLKADHHHEHAYDVGQYHPDEVPHYHHEAEKPELSGVYYLLGQFGDAQLTISYYIDSLTLLMFCVITLIASCIHFYAMGYMHDELHGVTDHEVVLEDGSHLQRPGRYHRFFQYLSLFSFSMLGLVLAGNLLMVFVFWELVGICSYFLIGFYFERKSASDAANKAFIVNRVGDFGMLIGLMIFWTGLGTFSFSEMFEAVQREDRQIVTPEGLVLLAARDEVSQYYAEHLPPRLEQALPPQADTQTRLAVYESVRAELDEEIRAELVPLWRAEGYGYWLLVIAGLGIFCGCVGKSAQFPLHVWLPDAMEGPTPVSALVHSATMVAAGVYLVARFFPVFAAEVLLVIAVIGAITLLIAATIALVATDIKRVLAYSTVSQLGYMMLALGVGGWMAGAFHLVTHAFFKSLLFLCSGSVIHAVHTNEMPLMGGLRKKMPVTAYTMLVGCLAIAGAGVPFVIGLSGYYSKDAILEQLFLFRAENLATIGTLLFVTALGGAAMTAFYMFRLWYLTFAGEPRDRRRYDHAHESPRVMTIPLVVLAVAAVAIAWQPFQAFRGADEADGPATVIARLPNLSLMGLLEQARPAGTLEGVVGRWMNVQWPNEHDAHAPQIRVPVTILAFLTALAGFALATAAYGVRRLDPGEVARQFQAVHRFLLNKWWFDELYHWAFFRPAHLVAGWVAALDRRWIDGIIDGSARLTVRFAVFWEWLADQRIVDALVNLAARWTYDVGASLRAVQTGQLRQYAMFVALATVALFILISFFWTPTLAR